MRSMHSETDSGRMQNYYLFHLSFRGSSYGMSAVEVYEQAHINFKPLREAAM